MNSIVPDSPGIAPFLTISRKIHAIPGLSALLRAPVHYKNAKTHRQSQGVLAWGRKPSAERAKTFAYKHNLPVILIEDGFLRSIDLGSKTPPLSIVIDDLGIYYDATTPSRFESFAKAKLSGDELSRARSLISAWQNNRVSKYNYAREFNHNLPESYVLVTDQTFGDASVKYGLANANDFNLMLEAAILENPESKIVIKIHPDVINGKKEGYFDIHKLKRNTRIVLIINDSHPVSLIERAQSVYCVTSQIGFEALLWGKKVRTFGMPFYGGWGLTFDEKTPPTRRHPISLENLVHTALIAYPRYLNPITCKECQVEELLSWIGLQRQIRERYPPLLYAHGFSAFKQQLIREFFQGSQIHFVKQPDQIPNDATRLVWGSDKIDFPLPSQTVDMSVLRLEDGFLRSVGLGAEFNVRPLSWTVDSRGIYYDSTQASDLEVLLQTTQFAEDIVVRAKNLRERIISNKLTKYNVGKNHIPNNFLPPQNKPRKNRVILVPGQVESDASIIYGAPKIRRNIDLLQAVRKAHPEDYLIYKPHPDVYAGLRSKGAGEHLAVEWCDEIVTDRNMGDLLNEVDEVHVMTSLTGFEALLRKKPVTCYGQPFYAGWGLTTDKVPLERRTRRLSLDELIAGVLIVFPLYLNQKGDCLISPEQAIDELLNWKAQQPTQKLSYYDKLGRLMHKYFKKK